MSEENLTEEKIFKFRMRLLRELNLRPGAELSLDSMEVMAVLVAVEETTGVELAFTVVRDCKTYDELEAAVREKV